jgi:serine/threonine-protein kinase
MTHRATELSLGMAAEQLYESLPKDTQRALADLPAVLKRLQHDAQALRQHYDDLQEALAEAGFAGASAEYAGVREARDAVHAKLGETVGALETIRLNLLRLHAGSTTIDGLTTHLGLAADVSREVERLIAARDDVERMIGFPGRWKRHPSDRLARHVHFGRLWHRENSPTRKAWSGGSGT